MTRSQTYLDEQATEIFNKILALLGDKDYIELGDCKCCNKLSVYSLGNGPYPPSFSKGRFTLAHYTETADIAEPMADPSMDFVVDGDGSIYPQTLRCDWAGILEDCTARGGRMSFLDCQLQEKLADFANNWLKYIASRLNITLQKGA